MTTLTVTPTVRLARRRGLIHFAQLSGTWCGRSTLVPTVREIVMRSHVKVARDIAAGRWCRTCAHSWWMSVGSRSDIDCGYRRSPVPARD